MKQRVLCLGLVLILCLGLWVPSVDAASTQPTGQDVVNALRAAAKFEFDWIDGRWEFAYGDPNDIFYVENKYAPYERVTIASSVEEVVNIAKQHYDDSLAKEVVEELDLVEKDGKLYYFKQRATGDPTYESASAFVTKDTPTQYTIRLTYTWLYQDDSVSEPYETVVRYQQINGRWVFDRRISFDFNLKTIPLTGFEDLTDAPYRHMNYAEAYADWLRSANTTSNDTFLLVYLDNDAVPELITIGSGGGEIYTFDNNGHVKKACELGKFREVAIAPLQGCIKTTSQDFDNTFYHYKNGTANLFKVFTSEYDDDLHKSTYKINETNVSMDQFYAQLRELEKSYHSIHINIPDGGYTIDTINIEKLRINPDVFAVGDIPETPPAKNIAYASTQTVTIDGKLTEFQMYALKDADGNATNYVKVRDVAQMLNGTVAQFSVGYDSAAKAVNLERGKPYTPNGSEMKTPYSGDRSYTVPTNATNVNGEASNLSAIVLTSDDGGGFTYYKLRDLGDALGFTVGWSKDRGVYIETGNP